MIRPSQIETTTVTPDQIGRCFKVVSPEGNFYKVESESDPSVEYAVRYSKEHGFTCTCPAGEHGFVNCHKGYCKHIAWAVAAAQEERNYIAALEAKQAKEQEAKLYAAMVAKQNATPSYAQALAMTHWGC